MWRNSDPYTLLDTVGENVKWCGPMENSIEVPEKKLKMDLPN